MRYGTILLAMSITARARRSITIGAIVPARRAANIRAQSAMRGAVVLHLLHHFDGAAAGRKIIHGKATVIAVAVSFLAISESGRNMRRIQRERAEKD